jgi:hypothetical protein
MYTSPNSNSSSNRNSSRDLNTTPNHPEKDEYIDVKGKKNEEG